MSDLLNDLVEAVVLADKATPGKWVCFPGGKRAAIYSDGGHIAFCSQRNFGIHGELPVSTEEMVSNATLIASIVNLFRTHHATIQQNAEDAKRLRALERAMEEWGEKKYVPAVDDLCVRWLRLRADEILREGEPHDQD